MKLTKDGNFYILPIHPDMAKQGIEEGWLVRREDGILEILWDKWEEVKK